VSATRAEVAKGLRMLAGAIEADETVPLPASCWPLTFHAGDRQHLQAIAVSLDARDRVIGGGQDEDGEPWTWLSGHVGGVAVRITADERPVLLDPLGEPETAWSLAEGLAAANLARNGALLDEIRPVAEAVSS
jgi:hypothetical protein